MVESSQMWFIVEAFGSAKTWPKLHQFKIYLSHLRHILSERYGNNGQIDFSSKLGFEHDYVLPLH